MNIYHLSDKCPILISEISLICIGYVIKIFLIEHLFMLTQTLNVKMTACKLTAVIELLHHHHTHTHTHTYLDTNSQQHQIHSQENILMCLYEVKAKLHE